MRRIGLRNCPYCGNAEVYTSQPKTWRDEVCRFFFLQVVRCHACMCRHYRPLFLPPVPTTAATKPIQGVTNEERPERSAQPDCLFFSKRIEPWIANGTGASLPSAGFYGPRSALPSAFKIARATK
jgi:hypothetical protein